MRLLCQLKIGHGGGGGELLFARGNVSVHLELLDSKSVKWLVNGRLPGTASDFVPRLRGSVGYSREPPVYDPSKRSESNS